MTLSAFVKSNLKHDESNREEVLKRAMKELGCRRDQFRKVIADIHRRGWNIKERKNDSLIKHPKVTEIAINRTIGISEEQFKARHDVFHIVSEAAKKLKKNRFLTEAEFIQVNGIRMIGYRDALNLPENSKYRGKVGAIIYWSHPETIAKYKSHGTLI